MNNYEQPTIEQYKLWGKHKFLSHHINNAKTVLQHAHMFTAYEIEQAKNRIIKAKNIAKVYSDFIA